MTRSTAAIKIAQKQLGLDDETYRAKLKLITGKSSTTQMTEAERQKVLKVFRQNGAAAPVPKPRQSFARVDGRDGKPKLSGKYLAQLRALWIAAYNLGVIDDNRDSALEAFILGRQLPHLSDVRFVHHADDLSSVVDALKAMLGRHGVEWASNAHPLQYAKCDGYKVAVAQWDKLQGNQSGHTFRQTIEAILPRSLSGREATKNEWILVMNTFGAEIRRLKRTAP